MKNQRGAVSGAVIAIVAVVAILLLIIPSYISAMNFGNRTEMSLKAKVEDNENIYAQGTQAVMEIAQVPSMMKNDLKELITAEIQGKYGKDGSQATVQFLRDRNIPIDASMYRAIQQQILAFRGKFENAQREMIDQRRSYETALGTFPRSIFLSMAGYPKIDLSKYTIVTTDKAHETFQTHRDSGIALPGLRPTN